MLTQAVLPVFGEQVRFVVIYMPEEASDMPENAAPFYCDIIFVVKGNIHNERILYDKITIQDNPHFEADMQSAFTKIRQSLAELPPFIISELESYYSLATVDTGKSENANP